MADMVEPDIDLLHGQVEGDGSELETGGHEDEVGQEPDEGDEESNPDG